MGEKPEQWTYTTGNYRSFLFFPSFEAACDGAFANSPDVLTAHVFAPDGGGLDVSRKEWHDMLWQRAGEEKS